MMKHINLFEEYSTPYSQKLSGLTPKMIESMTPSGILALARGVIDKGDKDDLYHFISVIGSMVKEGKLDRDFFIEITTMALNAGKIDNSDIEKYFNGPDLDTIRDNKRASLYNSLSNEIDTLTNDIKSDIKNKISMFISKHKLDYSDKTDLSNYIIEKIKKQINF